MRVRLDGHNSLKLTKPPTNEDKQRRVLMKTQVTSRQNKEQINESIKTNGKYKYILHEGKAQKYWAINIVLELE